MKIKRYRRILIFWTLFIGIGAVVGATGMISDPTGKAMMMDKMLPYFKVLPLADVLFKNLFFSGVALFIVNGLTQLITAILLFRHSNLEANCSIGCGIILMLWICIQFYMFPVNFLSTSYFIFGLVETLVGILLYKAKKSICA